MTPHDCNKFCHSIACIRASESSTEETRSVLDSGASSFFLWKTSDRKSAPKTSTCSALNLLVSCDFWTRSFAFAASALASSARALASSARALASAARASAAEICSWESRVTISLALLLAMVSAAPANAATSAAANATYMLALPSAASVSGESHIPRPLMWAGIAYLAAIMAIGVGGPWYCYRRYRSRKL